ncbi:MAG: hypothetical protein A2Y25_11425 [Candidatus Melainabacteria bacterium GWF2_37_15]|nr:MAG: hypothetical protein A2Y25_11425 [Candidatus Melainabacteria bacterium GWF2_37_15]
MKIVLVNNTFGNFGGGSEKATIETGRILQDKGHEVYYFASDRKPYYEKDYKYQNFFPKNSKKIFYNIEAKKKLGLLLKKVKPDLIHVHCFQHNLTPSVLIACKESGIPIVMTFHDSNFACPPGTLIKNGKSCTSRDCINGSLISCVKYRCFSNSFSKSLVSASEFFFKKSLGSYEIPEYIICPSQFILDLAVESGIKREKLVLISNFINANDTNNNSHKGYFLYAGRIVKEKGLYCLINAFKDLPHIRLRIAGKGAYETELQKFIEQNNIKNIEFIGLKKGIELENEYKNCFATVLSSLCGEAFGLSILESFSYGKPVIASRTGGIPEVINDYKDGIMVEPGNVEELKNAILKLWNNPELSSNFGKNAKIKFKNLYTAEVYYKKLINVYEWAISPRPEYSFLETIQQTY